MFKKFYTCEKVGFNEDSKRIEVVGSRVIGVSFWSSPITAYKELLRGCKADGQAPINFRRVN